MGYENKINQAKYTHDAERLSEWGKRGAEAKRVKKEAQERGKSLENLRSEIETWEAILASNDTLLDEHGEALPDDYKERVTEYLEGLRDTLEKLTGSRHFQ